MNQAQAQNPCRYDDDVLGRCCEHCDAVKGRKKKRKTKDAKEKNEDRNRQDAELFFSPFSLSLSPLLLLFFLSSFPLARWFTYLFAIREPTSSPP